MTSAPATIRLLDSATEVSAQDAGGVVVTGSHGGTYAAYLVAQCGVRAAVFNDAGVGCEHAGIRGLDYLQSIGVPAVAVAHVSARIGRATDTLQRGIVSHVNRCATALGCRPGQTCADATRCLSNATPCLVRGPQLRESRILLLSGAIPVWGLDSASLVLPTDAGSVIVAGSHGGLVGGRKDKALQVDGAAAIFHDAGVGLEEAGIGRLPALDERGIAAATVAAESARIGDARSMWSTGVISHINGCAADLGGRTGLGVREFAERLRTALTTRQEATMEKT